MSDDHAPTKRLIKKYPNRRLYDTEESRYIALAEIESLVLQHIDFWVQDTKTKEDITRSILLQVITEREQSGSPLLSQQVLEQLVRVYGAGLEDMAQSYLERSMTLWTETQDLLHEQFAKPLPADPVTAVQELTERNMKLWQDMQSNFLKAYQPPGATKPKR